MKHLVKGFTPMGGRHCITTALKQIFHFHGHPLSEPMLLGIASGLSFVYINQANSPMISGRSKPFEFENKLAERLNIEIKYKQPKKYDTAFAKAIDMIDHDLPVLIYVDMPFLEYLGLGSGSHFGGHAIVIAGYDDESQTFYVSDRDNHDHPIHTPKGKMAVDLHPVSYEQMALARNSNYRPFPANNKYLELDFSGYRPITKEVIFAAITDTCDSMLNPPANLLGLNGIMKFSKEIKKWRKFEPAKLKLAGITNYFQINGDGGTGGGIFRKLYGEFLMEAGNDFSLIDIATIGEQYIALAKRWDKLADLMWQLGQTGETLLLNGMSQDILHLYETERKILETLQSLV